MIDLLETFIEEPNSFENAKTSLLNSIETSRVIKSAVLFKYLSAQRLKQKEDIKKEQYKFISNAKIEDIKKFHEKHIQNQSRAFLMIGSKDKVDLKKLEKYGKVVELTLTDIFGY